MESKTRSHENRQHSSVLVPYSYYKCDIPEYFPYVPSHWHKEFEINYILSGAGEFRCGERAVQAKEGDIFIICPNQIHSIDSSGHVRYDTLVFSSDMLLSVTEDRGSAEVITPLITGGRRIDFPIDSANARYKEIKTTTEEVIKLAKLNCAVTDILLHSELLRLIWLLTESGAVSESGQAASDDPEIRTVIEYMTDNYCENITVKMLAEKAFLSKSYFMLRFREKTGMGAIEYLNRLRIRKVCGYLQAGGTSISSAAFSCGFRNLSNFNRLFRRIVGTSPAEYRARFNST